MIHFIGNAECPVKHGCAADNISNIHAIHIWSELLPFLCLCINNIRKHKLLWPLLNMKCQMKIFKFAMTLDPRARGAGLGWAAASVAEYCQPKTTEFCLILWLSRHSRHWLDKAMSLNSEIIINSYLHLDTWPFGTSLEQVTMQATFAFFFHFAFRQGGGLRLNCLLCGVR